MNPRQINRRFRLAGLLVWQALVCGCAVLPRIDPTGERILVWPKDQRTTPLAVPSLANVQAPPVLTDPVFPPAPPIVAAPALQTAASPLTAPAYGGLPGVAVSNGPQDRLTLSPTRVLAPVGSEVVLKAAICATEGYTLADEKIEWMLGRNGVGEFVEVGGKGMLHPPLLPLWRGKKIDSYLAHGFTADGPLCIDRGTADPADDVNINRGDAWISVTSPHEGTSYVTAYAPRVESWNDRRSSASIYWVDVQWVFPPASVVSSGRPQTLTTTVTRQSDGTPIEGWLVRYEVADGGVIAGGGSGQTVEIRTGADGKATVEVAPTALGAASSQINVQLVRPAGFRQSDAPRLVIANGATLVRWSGDSQPYLPPSTAQPPPTNIPPLSTAPPISSTPLTPTPIPSTPPRRPQLEVEIRGPTTAQVGSQARFEAIVRNSGNGPATSVVVTDDFQLGLSHIMATRGEQRIEYSGIGTLQPNEQKSAIITFDVNAAGQLCHDVTVTSAEGVSSAPKRACIDAREPPRLQQGRLQVEKDGPLFAIVGDNAAFTVVVKNIGEVALTNISVQDEYPVQFFRITAADQNALRVGGTLRYTIDRLEAGQSRRFDVECLPLQVTNQVQMLVTVGAEAPPNQPISTSDEHVLEIRPRRDGAGGAFPAAGAGLDIRASFNSGRTVRTGTRTTCQVTVQNLSNRLAEQVEVRVQFPPQLTPDVASVQGPSGVSVQSSGGRLVFTPVAMLREKEEVTYLIPVNVSQTGVVDTVVEVRSAEAPQGVSRQVTLEIAAL